VYGKSYGKVYVCDNFPDCDSYVGVHRGTNRPLGTLANKELRKARMECHNVFDQSWRSGRSTRDDAYRTLAITTGVKEPHFWQFTLEQCNKFLEATKLCR
jgi:ssDNA-binding Zn-finger/Zn-ribbon topoisomerase 1